MWGNGLRPSIWQQFTDRSIVWSQFRICTTYAILIAEIAEKIVGIEILKSVSRFNIKFVGEFYGATEVNTSNHIFFNSVVHGCSYQG